MEPAIWLFYALPLVQKSKYNRMFIHHASASRSVTKLHATSA